MTARCKYKSEVSDGQVQCTGQQFELSFLHCVYTQASRSLVLSVHNMSSYDSHQYFVPGYSISRHIIFSHINYYLGPYASVRPFSYRGREGYLVTAPGQPLTRVSGFVVQLFDFCS